jgi:hypothetical protein
MSTRFFQPSASASSVASTLTDPYFSMLNSEEQAGPGFTSCEREREPTSTKHSGSSSPIKLTTTEEKARENHSHTQSPSKSLFAKLFGRRCTTKSSKKNPADKEGCFHKIKTIDTSKCRPLGPETLSSTKVVTPRESKALDCILPISTRRASEPQRYVTSNPNVPRQPLNPHLGFASSASSAGSVSVGPSQLSRNAMIRADSTPVAIGRLPEETTSMPGFPDGLSRNAMIRADSTPVVTALPSRSKPDGSPRTSGTTRVDGSGHELSASGCQGGQAHGQPQNLKEPPAQQPMMMFEVAPGHYVSLRGGEEETMRYIFEKRPIATQECICCEGTIHCIADAELLLCPFCRVAQPLFSATEGSGLALGFCTQDYIQMAQDGPSTECARDGE